MGGRRRLPLTPDDAKNLGPGPAAPIRRPGGPKRAQGQRVARICAAFTIADLKGLHDFEPGKQEWASQMASLLTGARDAASAARQAGQSSLDAAVLDDLFTRYRALAAAGLAANLYRRTATAQDARRIARRFLSFEDLILRFATRPDLDIFTNNEAGRTIRPVKAQQRSSGGSWRTLTGLANFAVVAVLPIHRNQVGHQYTRRPP